MPLEPNELEHKQQELEQRLHELEEGRDAVQSDADTLFSRLPQNELTSTEDRHLHKRLGRLNLRPPRELTIVSGFVNMTRGYHTIDTQSDASSDNLAGIRNGRAGEVIWIQPENDARTIVVKHNDTSEGTDGNRIFLNAKADTTLDGVEDMLALIYDPAADSAKGAWRDYPLTFGGGLGFCYDYLVMSGWTGTEGQTITIPDSTETFQVYSTIGGAVSAANTANTAGKTFSIGICPGTYNESISWPNSAAGNTYSALLIRGLGVSDSHDDFDEVYWSTTSAGVSPIELDASGPVGMQIENLAFNAVAGQPAIDWSAGINLSGHAINCEFRDPVEMETAGFWFHHCEFKADFDGEDSDDVFFLDCRFGTNAGVDLRGDNFSGVTIIGCDFVMGAGTTPSIQLDGGEGIQIIGNNFSHSGSLSDCITIDNNAVARQLHEILIEDNSFGYRPADGGALIRVTTETATSSEEIWNVVITGNAFSQTFSTGSATTAWIKLTGNATNKVFGITVAHNAFGSTGGQASTIEDQAGFTVLADYLERSILGPNTLVGKVKYEVTNGANNLIIPPSADDNGSSSSGNIGTHVIQDADADTKVDTEESADEDIIRMDAGGVEVSTIGVAGRLILPVVGSLAGLQLGDDVSAEALLYSADFDLLTTPDDFQILRTAGELALRLFNPDSLSIGSFADSPNLRLMAAANPAGPASNMSVDQAATAITEATADWEINLGGNERMRLSWLGQLRIPATGSGNGILIGGDGQIYRASANILRTPDSFTVDADLKVSGSLNLDADSTLTISTGSVTATGSYHTIAGQSGAADNLDLIAGGVDGDLLVLRPSSDSVTITVRHNQNAANANNILLSNNSAATLDDEDDVLVLLYEAGLDTNGAWIEVVRNNPNTAVDHGSIAGLGDDDHSQYALLAGRSGSQSLAGSPNDDENLTLRANSGGTGQTGILSTEDAAYHDEFLGLNLRDFTTLTIATGLITTVQSTHRLQAQSGTSDNLAGINARGPTGTDATRQQRNGRILILRPISTHSITVQHNDTSEGTVGDRIFLHGAVDVLLASEFDLIMLVYDQEVDSANGGWVEISRPSTASTITAGEIEIATTAEIDTGTDATRAMPVDQFVASDRNIRFITIRLVEAATDVAVATTVGGDWVCPFTGTLLQSDTDINFLSANTDTAGTTGTMVVDIHKGGTTVMTTNKLDIESAEKSTNTATTQPDLTTTAVTAGDVFTFDVDAIHTTAAKGLSVTMAIRLT